jgi:hypothetical protein
MPHWNNQRWQRNLSKTASGKPGAVQAALSWPSTVQGGYVDLSRFCAAPLLP